MCDSHHQISGEKKAATQTSSNEVVAEPAAPKKVCNCDKPCCRNQLIKQAATSAKAES